MDVNIFDNAEDLFHLMKENKDSVLQFSFHTEEDLDNYESMALWLESNGLDDFVIEDEQSLVVLEHPDFDFQIDVQSYGEGDFYSHGISCEVTSS